MPLMRSHPRTALSGADISPFLFSGKSRKKEWVLIYSVNDF